MKKDIGILPHERKVILDDIFENQRVQIVDYETACICKSTFDILIEGLKWQSDSEYDFGTEISVPSLDEMNASFFYAQILAALQTGGHVGKDVRIMIGVIEKLQNIFPDIA